MLSKRNLLFQGVIFKFHVKLWEGRFYVYILDVTTWLPESFIAVKYGGPLYSYEKRTEQKRAYIHDRLLQSLLQVFGVSTH